MISGAALVVHNLAHTMVKRGHQVLVIAASDTGKSYRVQDENLTVLRLRSIHNPLRVGQRFLLFPRHSIMNALREFRPEIIHAHEPLNVGLLGVAYSRLKYIPIALTIHQLPSFAASYLPVFLRRPTEMALWSYARLLGKKFTCIITPTETISSHVAKRLGRTVNTISNGIDLQTYYPSRSPEEVSVRRKWNLPLDVPLLLHVGRLDSDKQVDHVIRAAAPVVRESDAHLLIVGDGVQKPALMKLCSSLGITGRVHFTGFVSSKQELPDIYRMATLFVTASEIETQGIVLLEAAASGLPIVAVRATCIPEIVRDGANGLLAEPGDLHGLRDAMNTLLKDKEKAIQMGKASREIAQHHQICFSMDAHEKLYYQLIQQATVAYPARKPRRWALGGRI